MARPLGHLHPLRQNPNRDRVLADSLLDREDLEQDAARLGWDRDVARRLSSSTLARLVDAAKGTH